MIKKQENSIRKIETKFNISQESKDKIKNLSLRTKKNNSELIEDLILNFDEDFSIIKNINYSKNRERVFVEVAHVAKDLKSQQEEYKQLLEANFSNTNSLESKAMLM